MAFSKAHLYPPDLRITSEKMKAFAYPARMDILLFLLLHGPACVQEIAKYHPISQEALSGHLAILRAANLVNYNERYPYTFYKLDRTNLQLAIALIRSLLDRFDDDVSKNENGKP